MKTHEEESEFIAVDGPALVAKILKALPANVSQRLTAALQDRDPQIFTKIELSYFALDEITTLPPAKIQALVSRASHKDLVFALQAASDDAKEHVLSHLSERKQKVIAEDLSFPLIEKGAELKEAHRRITDLIEEIKKGAAPQPLPKKGLKYA